MQKHSSRTEQGRAVDGFSLLELSLSLMVMALLLATLLPLQRSLEERRREWWEQTQMDQWMSQIEGFALTHRRLPCPSNDIEGVEQAASQYGPCNADNGWLPWRAIGLTRPGRVPLYAVASLDSLGTPYARLLTTRDGFKTVPIDLLSAAIFAPPDTSGSSPGTLPALLVSDFKSGSASTESITLTGMPCSGQLFLTVSAVALVSSDASQKDQFTGNNRCYRIPPPAGKARMSWLSYERLVWLYIRAGLLGGPL